MYIIICSTQQKSSEFNQISMLKRLQFKQSKPAAVKLPSQDLISKDGSCRSRRKFNQSYEKSRPELNGLSKKQLDTILEELCEQYNCMWTIVSTMLFKDHGIDWSEATIRNRYTQYLNPKLKKQRFNFDEVKVVLKMFFVEGKRFHEIVELLGNRERTMIRNIIEMYSRKGVRNLEKRLGIRRKQKVTHINGYCRRSLLVNQFKTQDKEIWQHNQYSMTLFYFFIVSDEEQLERIPKQLAELLHRRFDELTLEKLIDSQENYQLKDPQLYHNKEADKRSILSSQEYLNKIKRRSRKKKNKESVSNKSEDFQDLDVSWTEDEDSQEKTEQTNQIEENSLWDWPEVQEFDLCP